MLKKNELGKCKMLRIKKMDKVIVKVGSLRTTELRYLRKHGR